MIHIIAGGFYLSYRDVHLLCNIQFWRVIKIVFRWCYNHTFYVTEEEINMKKTQVVQQTALVHLCCLLWPRLNFQRLPTALPLMNSQKSSSSGAGCLFKTSGLGICHDPAKCCKILCWMENADSIHLIIIRLMIKYSLAHSLDLNRF